ncbi:MAG: AEC family transporter [Rhodospirillales bacterium]
MLSQLLNIIAPVAIAVAIGFAWRRKGLAFDIKLVSALVTNIGTPCLVFSTLSNVEIGEKTFVEMALATFVTLCSFAAISAIAFRASGIPARTFLPSMVFANTGNVGLPLSLFAFGTEGLALAVTYFTIHLILLFTIGELVSAGSLSVGKIVRQPVLYAVPAALVVLIGDLTVPMWLENTTKLLGDFTIPLMLITLGISLADLKIGGFRRSLVLSVFRLVMGFAVGVAAAEAFGLEGVSRGVLILQSAMPVAVFNYLFAVRNDNSPEEVAGIIVLSTAIAFALLPALLWFVL